MNPLSKRITAGVISVLVAFLLTAAVLHEASPFYQDAARNPPMRMFVLLINTPSVFALTAFRSLPLGILIFALQWFLFGYLVGWIFHKIRLR